jgi:hypothetical protein
MTVETLAMKARSIGLVDRDRCRITFSIPAPALFEAINGIFLNEPAFTALGGYRATYICRCFLSIKAEKAAFEAAVAVLR